MIPSEKILPEGETSVSETSVGAAYPEGGLSVLIDEAAIRARIPILAGEIVASLGPERRVHVLSLLHGGLWFTADLMRYLPRHYTLSTMRASSYGGGTSSSGSIAWLTPWGDVRGLDVLVIDDVLDSGLTLHAVREKLFELGASSVTTAVAVCKNCPRSREIGADFGADFVAFHTENEFLVGYGMDYAERFRNLPFIAIYRPC